MKSGMVAAEAVWGKLEAGDSPTEGVHPEEYETSLKNSWVWDEMKAVRSGGGLILILVLFFIP